MSGPITPFDADATDVNHFNNWSPPGAGDVRSPCPFLNTLANHSLLPHSGRGITHAMLRTVLASATIGAHLPPDFADEFAEKGTSVMLRPGENFFNLDRLGVHGVIEHDVSLSRDDAALGDNASFSWERWKEVLHVLADGKEAGVVEMRDVMSARYMRVVQSQRRHREAGVPMEYGIREAFLGIGETALWFNVVGDGRTVPLEFARVFFEQQRMPYAEGWRPRKTEFTTSVVRQSIWALVKAHPHKFGELWIIAKGTTRSLGRKIAGWFRRCCGRRSG